MAPHVLLDKEAPTNITVKDQHDKDVNLADHIGKSILVLFFYPKDGSFVCSKEVCAFRDRLEEIQKLGAQVIGVSGGNVKAHEQFATKQNLSYPLLADTEGELRTAFKVSKLLFGFPQRTTYIIDEDGIVINVFESFFSYNYHITNVLKALQKDSKLETEEVELEEEEETQAR